MTVSVN